jgi:chromosome segregation ATPase
MVASFDGVINDEGQKYKTAFISLQQTKGLKADTLISAMKIRHASLQKVAVKFSADLERAKSDLANEKQQIAAIDQQIADLQEQKAKLQTTTGGAEEDLNKQEAAFKTTCDSVDQELTDLENQLTEYINQVPQSTAKKGVTRGQRSH